MHSSSIGNLPAVGLDMGPPLAHALAHALHTHFYSCTIPSLFPHDGLPAPQHALNLEPVAVPNPPSVLQQTSNGGRMEGAGAGGRATAGRLVAGGPCTDGARGGGNHLPQFAPGLSISSRAFSISADS